MDEYDLPFILFLEALLSVIVLLFMFWHYR